MFSLHKAMMIMGACQNTTLLLNDHTSMDGGRWIKPMISRALNHVNITCWKVIRKQLLCHYLHITFYVKEC